jgi:hypothetical protein
MRSDDSVGATARMALKFRLAAQDDRAAVLEELVQRVHASPMAPGLSVRGCTCA